MEPTPAPWIDGNSGDSIIAPNASGTELAFTEAHVLDFYGGVLVAESVSPRNKPLIKAAPRMRDALKRIAAWEFNLDDDCVAEARTLASAILVEIEREPAPDILTDAKRRLVELDLRKKEIENYYEDLQRVVAAVAEEVGVNGYFAAEDGAIYKIVKPSGRFVIFKELDFVRTKRAGEERGSLSMKEAEQARANGFKPLS